MFVAQGQQGYRTLNAWEGTQKEKGLIFASRQSFLKGGRLYFVDILYRFEKNIIG